jgi:hypothetical protein
MKKHYKYTLSRALFVPYRSKVQAGESVHLKDKRGNTWAILRHDGLLIQAGYSWDGCSPKYSVFGVGVGVWDGFNIFHPEIKEICQQAKYPSLVHDVFYQFWDQVADYTTKPNVDNYFYFDLVAVNFPLSGLYYWFVRKLGTWFTGGNVK